MSSGIFQWTFLGMLVLNALTVVGFPNGRISNAKFPNGQIANAKFPNGQIANDFPNGQSANDFPNGQIANAKFPNGQIANAKLISQKPNFSKHSLHNNLMHGFLRSQTLSPTYRTQFIPYNAEHKMMHPVYSELENNLIPYDPTGHGEPTFSFYYQGVY